MKFFLFILFLSASLGAVGQMSVTQFEPLPHDLDAKVNYPRKSQYDGQLYALIKISTGLNCDGFTRFDFGSVGYGEVDCEHGTWVYAPATASRISITHTVAGTMENYLLPAPLEAGRVYSMTLTGGRVYTHVEETLNVGYLSVECNVPGATLRLGTQDPKVMADTYYSTTIAPGTYDYEVTAAGYEPERGRITVRQEETGQLTVRLVSSNGTLQVHSEPAGAAILVDGQLQNAHTPATLTLLKGTHRVMLTKDLYKTTEQEVTIQPGGTGEVRLTLAPDFGTVEVQAANPGDSIYIDRQFRATGTWRGDLASGLHVLEASRASHRPHRRDFSVTAGQPLSLSSPALEPLYGKLQVLVTNNQKASVYIDGKQRSPLTPCMVQDVLVGRRAVRIVPENEDYQPYETYVTILEGKVETVEAGLEEKPKTGALIISSDVYFSAYVDDVYMGHSSSNKSLLLTLPMGKHEIKLTNDNYEPIIENIEIRPGAQGLYRSLKPKTASIYVKSNVSAKVYVDGKYHGNVPLLITLPLGKHEVVWEYGKMKEKEIVEVEGYENVYKHFNIKYRGSKTSSNSTTKLSGGTYIRPSTYRYTRERIDPYFYMDYRMSAGSYGVSPIGFSMGYSGRWGGYYQFRAGKRIFHLTGGIMYNPTSWLALQAGAGWGGELIEGETGASGLEFEIGAIYRMDVLLISAGYSYNWGLKCHEGYIGIGFFI